MAGENTNLLLAGEKSSQAGKDRIFIMLEATEEKKRQKRYRTLAGWAEVAADLDEILHLPDDSITGIEAVPM